MGIKYGNKSTGKLNAKGTTVRGTSAITKKPKLRGFNGGRASNPNGGMKKA